MMRTSQPYVTQLPWLYKMHRELYQVHLELRKNIKELNASSYAGISIEYTITCV
jgi:hypothetical protein